MRLKRRVRTNQDCFQADASQLLEIMKYTNMGIFPPVLDHLCVPKQIPAALWRSSRCKFFKEKKNAFGDFNKLLPESTHPPTPPPAVAGPNWFLGSRAVTPQFDDITQSVTHGRTSALRGNQLFGVERERERKRGRTSLQPKHQLREIFTCALPGRIHEDFSLIFKADSVLKAH